MKLTVTVNSLMAKGIMGTIKAAKVTLIGYRQRQDEDPVELFRLPIAGQTKTAYTIIKYYANPEGGLDFDEFMVEIVPDADVSFSLNYNVQLNHAPPPRKELVLKHEVELKIEAVNSPGFAPAPAPAAPLDPPAAT